MKESELHPTNMIYLQIIVTIRMLIFFLYNNSTNAC